jgi:hypothetical protein
MCSMCAIHGIGRVGRTGFHGPARNLSAAATADERFASIRSGHAPIAVVQTADLRHCHDTPGGGRLDRTRARRVALKG